MVVTIDGLEHYQRVTRKFGGFRIGDPPAVYRGHRDIAWQLLPSVARLQCASPNLIAEHHEDHSVERGLLVLFRTYVAALAPPWVWAGTDTVVG